MCGIAGFINIGGRRDGLDLFGVATAMADCLAHRGPDDSGVWVDAEAGAALGHRRLSIIDLSADGHQPMVSSCGRYVISYNGEVYNFESVRAELLLEGKTFRGRSDTEIILEAVAVWGLVAAVKKFVGMFAIALWDRQERRLHLVRDRLGIKPLYYGRAGNSFLFCSELKAALKHPDFKPVENAESLALYFHYGYIPSPHTIYKGIHSLLPGSILTVDPSGSETLETYWSATDVAFSGVASPLQISESDAVEELESLLMDSVKLRMISDVPLGSFLSGGIDSSLVAALMQAQSAAKIKTFSIGFNEAAYNEAEHAARVAQHLGTDHTECYLSDREAMEIIPLLPDMYDEPFADFSQIPSHLVSRMTRKNVTVALTGDGGDELFCGYAGYFRAASEWAKKGRLPAWQRKALAAGLRAGAAPGMEWTMLPALPLLAMKGKSFAGMRERALHRARGLDAKNFDAFYNNFLAIYPDLPGLLNGDAASARRYFPSKQNLKNPFEKMMLFDMIQYLPDDILAKVDRASMSVSLEARVPMLDHRVVEFAWKLPLSFKTDGANGKLILKKLLYKHIPREIVDRPKMGFAVPVGQWIKGPMREWAEELLSPVKLSDCGVLRAETVRDKWKEHLSGKCDHERMLWSVLMYMSWRNRWRNT